ncbi:hypothetical protein [Saccharothrix sp. Mg75]|uniref:hypothetical protein n=1 Tax=Saccharothrix sp. Mg75 TaxID=3445357 RepID=UPI003EEB1E66
MGPEPFRVDASSHAFDHHNGVTPVAPEPTTRLLRPTGLGQNGDIVEGGVFAHLFALLSLHRIVPGHPVIHEGISALVKAVRDDGGMPFLVSEEIFCTATHLLAFLHGLGSRR